MYGHGLGAGTITSRPCDASPSEWVFTGTGADGRKVEVNGCDVFTFRRGKIAIKSSFFEQRTSPCRLGDGSPPGSHSPWPRAWSSC
jgi:hypothetical protein